MRTKNINLFILTLLVATSAFVLFSFIAEKNSTELQTAYLYSPPQAISHFQLESTTGTPLTAEALKGQWTFIFTGYTSCPDICPTTMAMLKNHWQELTATSKAPVQVWLVSVDPQRDNIERLSFYAGFFGEQFIGLRAEHEALYPLMTSLNLMYSIPDEGVKNYAVAHSAALILINPDGQQHAIFQPLQKSGGFASIHPDALVHDFKKIVRAYQP